MTWSGEARYGGAVTERHGPVRIGKVWQGMAVTTRLGVAVTVLPHRRSNRTITIYARPTE